MKNTAVLFALAFVSTASIASAQLVYGASLSGTAENPVNASPGTGFAQVTYNQSLHNLQVHVTFTGLLGTTTASHIHGPVTQAGGTAGVITTTPYFANFPLGVSSGTYDNTLDLTLASSYNPAFVTANGGSLSASETALAASLAAGTAYLNIHTTSFPGGEIRGFLTLVPEPSTFALMGLGVTALALRRRKLSI